MTGMGVSVISRVSDWVSARVEDEMIMMNVERGKYIGLTETGARIWDLLAEPRTAEDLCAALCEEYDIAAEQCRTEVDAFVAEMQKQGALTADA